MLVLASCSCGFPTEGTATNPTSSETTSGSESETTNDSTDSDPTTTSESTTEQTTDETATDDTTTAATSMGTSDATTMDGTETMSESESDADTDPTEGAEFDAVQFYCSGTCRATKPSVGGDGCDADDANTFCRLMYGDPAYTAVSWESVPTLDGPGFCCLDLGDQDNHLTDVEGYDEVCFEPDSLLPAHESGLVIPLSTLVCAMGG